MAGRTDGGPASRQRHDGDTDWAQELLGHPRPAGRDLGRLVAWLARRRRTA